VDTERSLAGQKKMLCEKWKKTAKLNVNRFVIFGVWPVRGTRGFPVRAGARPVGTH